MSDGGDRHYRLKEYEDDDDYPMKECRGTEPRLALLQLFSIGNAYDAADPKLSRSLSAPALFNHVQEWCYSNQGQYGTCIVGELPLTDFDRYRRMVQSPSLASIDTEHHSNCVTYRYPDISDLSSTFTRNIAQREVAVSRELDTNRVRNHHSGRRNVDVVAYGTSICVHQNHIVDSLADKITEAQRCPVKANTTGKSFWNAQEHQETTGKDISIYDTKSATGIVGVLVTNVPAANPHRQSVNLAPFISSSATNYIRSPITQAGVENVAEQTDLGKNKYTPNLKREKLPFAPVSCREQRYDDELNRVHQTDSFASSRHYPHLDTMPAVTARRGPPTDNGDAVRHGAGYIQSNGRVAVRPQNGIPNETQRNHPPTGGMNGAADSDLNPPLHNDLASQQPTPLFERLVTEEVQELRAYVRIVENQNRRLVELERVHGDLEVRLEIESKARQQLEATLEAREREWAEQLEHVERERDTWKALVEAEKIKNSKLIDQVYRKDQDIHRMLQRKVRRYICFYLLQI